MKKIKCKVCEYEFDAVRSGHYVTRDDGKCGLAAVRGGNENKTYDTFDCPICGCQVVVQERKRQYEYLDVKEGKDSVEE